MWLAFCLFTLAFSVATCVGLLRQRAAEQASFLAAVPAYARGRPGCSGIHHRGRGGY